MRISGGLLIFVSPVLAIIGFGACLAWERLEVVDTMMTGSIK